MNSPKLQTDSSHQTMEELLASLSGKTLAYHRGDEVLGEVISISKTEIILDLGSKAEGVISKHDFNKEELENVALGSKVKAYVVIPENNSNQVVLSPNRQQPQGFGLQGPNARNFSKFTQALKNKQHLVGQVLEANKGGLIVEVLGVKGFLPISQISFSNIGNIDKLMGGETEVVVIEVDGENHKLIFSQRTQVSDQTLAKIRKFQEDQKVKCKIVAVLPFGLSCDVLGVEGFIFKSEASWEKIDNLSEKFKAGDEFEALVCGIDEELGRINLSIKRLQKDPFEAIALNLKVESKISGVVASVTGGGVVVSLGDGIEGFMPINKMDPTQTYQVGQNIDALIDVVDSARRRIILVPFITTTKGLIYK